MGRLAVDCLKQDDREAVNVGTAIGRFALQLLWRHVVKRAERRGELRCRGTRARNPEIRQPCSPSVVHHDVGGLDVEMDDTSTVGILQCVTDVCRPAHGIGNTDV